MLYTSCSLNGCWEMQYLPEAFSGGDLPLFRGFHIGCG